MSSSSSSYRSSTTQQILPLVPCPRCGAEIVTKICRRGTRPGVRFYMCTHYSDGVCPFFEWQDTYAANLGHQQQVHPEAQTQACRSATGPSDGQAAQLPPTEARPPVARVLEGHPVQGSPPPDTVEACDQKAHVATPDGPVLQQSAPRMVGSADLAVISLIVSVINLAATVLVLGVVVVMAFSPKQ
ncbi:hypothetical protein QYE76_070636 [Lolium multiflorum]|uniref:GRF-type domain-containing protein n=1 Tax=Lolium multiflorum TaxID=4521 RepID=A0AAD8WDT5_LOLMU|nr:hypothetical protein QYE76_070636 [Lolium multiflorum]